MYLYLLDTNTCAYIINRRPLQVRERLAHYRANEVGVSSLTIAELRYGADKSSHPAQNHENLAIFLLSLGSYSFGVDAAVSLWQAPSNPRAPRHAYRFARYPLSPLTR